MAALHWKVRLSFFLVLVSPIMDHDVASYWTVSSVVSISSLIPPVSCLLPPASCLLLSVLLWPVTVTMTMDPRYMAHGAGMILLCSYWWLYPYYGSWTLHISSASQYIMHLCIVCNHSGVSCSIVVEEAVGSRPECKMHTKCQCRDVSRQQAAGSRYHVVVVSSGYPSRLLYYGWCVVVWCLRMSSSQLFSYTIQKVDC